MSIVTDSLMAFGTLLIAGGSALQAFDELGRYEAILGELAVTGVVEAYRDLVSATIRVMMSLYFPLNLMPPKFSIKHLKANIKALRAAIPAYLQSTNKLGAKTKLTAAAEAEKKPLSRKATYWGLSRTDLHLFWQSRALRYSQTLPANLNRSDTLRPVTDCAGFRFRCSCPFRCWVRGGRDRPMYPGRHRLRPRRGAAPFVPCCWLVLVR
jgi:hypothetical protein